MSIGVSIDRLGGRSNRSNSEEIRRRVVIVEGLPPLKRALNILRYLASRLSVANRSLYLFLEELPDSTLALLTV